MALLRGDRAIGRAGTSRARRLHEGADLARAVEDVALDADAEHADAFRGERSKRGHDAASIAPDGVMVDRLCERA